MQQNTSCRQTCKKRNFHLSLLYYKTYTSIPPKSTATFSSIKSENYIPLSVYLGSSNSNLDEDKAKVFNHYFFSAFTHSSYKLPSLHEISHITPALAEICLDECEVYTVLASLACNKATGIDGICPDVLKPCAAPLTKPFHHLFCHCISKHDLPSEWRTHCITPIFKSGDKHNVANYRPISLLCVTSKVLERLVFNHLIGYLTKHLSNQQFGFMTGRSSLQQLLLFMNNILEAIGLN